MARNPFAGVDVPGTVQSEFTARADTNKMLQWAAKRVPWIHVMSMASSCDGKYTPLGNAAGVPALFGSVSSQAMYNNSTLLPLPIITGCDVAALGNLGTTRKANIKIKCYTDEDLVELQKCYFIPGMDIRVQFGWSESCSGAKPSVYLAKSHRATALCEIRSRAQSNPAYDGFQGTVANFKYSLQPDNTWECDLEINSAAEPFSQSNVSDSQCDCARKEEVETQEGDKKEVVKKNGQLYSMLLDSFRDPSALYEWLGKISAKAPSTLTPHIAGSSRFYWGKARTEGGGDDSGMFEGTFFNDYDTTEPFISYGALEAAINVLTLPNNGKYPYGRVDSSGVILSTPDDIRYVMSTDPRVCWIPGGYKQDYLSEPDRNGFPGNPQNAVMGGGISLCDIQVNVLFLMLELKKVLDGDKLMVTFLRNVLTEINKVCGSLWNIEVVSDSETKSACSEGISGGTGGQLTVIDAKKFDPAAVWKAPSKATNSAIRGFSLDLKLTDAMKTQALYAGGTQQKGSGNTENGGDATGCEGVSMDAFYIGGTVTNDALPAAKGEEADCLCDEISNAEKAENPTLSSLAEECRDYVCDETCKALQTQLVGDIQKYSESGDPAHCKGVPLPFDFGFECDGIGGFGFGQYVSSDRIPQAIRDNFFFQIIKAEHTITANDWVTKISTVARAVPGGGG